MTAPSLATNPPLFSPALKAVIGCAICLSVGLIPLFMGVFPVFLTPVSAQFHWGLSVFPQAPLIAGLTGALVGPFIGRLIDRRGVRALLPPGIIVWVVGLWCLSLMNGSLPALYGSAVLLGTGGTIAGPIAFAKVINGWFDRHRGLALAIAMSGVPAVATAIGIQVSQGMVDAYGWRSAYRLLALVSAMISLPAVLLIREASRGGSAEAADVPLPDITGLSGSQAMRSRDFFVTVVATALAAGALMGVCNHFLAWAAERGIDRGTASLALSMYSLVGPLGPLAGGLLVDRIPSPRVLSIFFAMAPLGMILLILGHGPMLVAGMIALGLAFSSINGFAPYLVSRYFGLKAASEILAVTFALLTVGMGLGPVLMGLAHDTAHGYGAPLLGAAAIATFAFILSLAFGPYRFAPPPSQ